MSAAGAPRVQRVRLTGDAALTAEFEPRADVAINRAAAALGRVVRGAALGGVRDVVVTTSAVTVYVDPLAVDWRALGRVLETPVPTRADATGADPTGADPTEVDPTEVDPTEVDTAEADPIERAEPIVVPTRYGGADGPDLAEVAERCGCSPDEVVARHVDRLYRVFMVGFMPGFAYLGPLDARLRLPRRASPRLRVPAGSVAIAGEQTAVYPLETPGGWWIIGRSALRVFDADREPPTLFDVGRPVRFEAL
jgi:5-oxoprolinase (ATP-hydrolysing) subunit B